jgi:glutathione S-transferase
MATLYIIPVVDVCHGVQCLIAETKLNITIKALDFLKEEASSPEFLAKNPFGVCPTLEEGGHVLWESHTILRYLCNKFNLSQWYSQSDALARARIDDALDWKHRVLHPCIRKSVFGSLESKLQGQEEVKINVAEFESLYLKDGKFINGSSEPTIADLSIRPALNWLTLFEIPVPKGIQAYNARFDARVSSYQPLAACQKGFVAEMKVRTEAPPPPAKAAENAGGEKGKEKEQPKGKEAEKGTEKAERKQSEKGGEAAGKKSEQGGAKKAEAPKKEGGSAAVKKTDAAAGEGKLDDKRAKACEKEGGKKGQDMAGMSTFGSHYFCPCMEEPKGEMQYLELCLQGANREVDPEAEDRKGGAGDIGKLFVSSNDNVVSLICHVPKERTELTIKEWFGHVMASVGAKPFGEQTPFIMRAQVAADPDNGKFTIKMKDVAIGASFQFLRERGLVLDESDDETNYAAAAGVNFNAAPGADY